MNSPIDVSAERIARIAAFLDAHHVMSLATGGPDGPHAANLFYTREGARAGGHDGFTLVWVSDPASEHSVHVANGARVAATIARDYSDFPEIAGLQLVGEAGPIAGQAERRRARSCLEARYPFLHQAAARVARVREAYDRAQFYRLSPRRITLIDNSRGFGFKETIELPPGRPAP